MAEQFRPRRDLYQETTDKIVAALESGTVPWRRPWNPDQAAPTGPVNATTGKAYRGINVLMLGMSPHTWATGDPRWCSYKQAEEKGWQVRKGEKASTVLFFKMVEFDTDSPDQEGKRLAPVLRSYPVFHASQMDNVPAYVPPTPAEVPWRTPEAAETILAASGVPVREGGSRAFYTPSQDFIQLPPRATFSSPEGWAATALHELGHATGHPTRLNRDLGGRFASHRYAREELRAELASAFLSGQLGIPSQIDQHASYVDSWLEVLKQDRREIFHAAADAQRISDWCLARHPDYAASMDVEVQPEPTPTASPRPAPAPEPSIAAVAAMGPLPAHISRRLRPAPASPTEAPMPTPTPQEAPTWSPRM